MTYLHLYLKVADILYHLIIYLMCAHALKLDMTLLPSVCYFLLCLICPNMWYSSLSSNQTLRCLLSLFVYHCTCPDILHIALMVYHQNLVLLILLLIQCLIYLCAYSLFLCLKYDLICSTCHVEHNSGCYSEWTIAPFGSLMESTLSALLMINS